MRTTINVTDTMLERAKAAAIGRGVTLGELFEDALRAYLSATKKPKPSEFRLHTVRGRLVDPNLDLDRTSALLVTDDESTYISRR
jgi:hypothetical protein